MMQHTLNKMNPPVVECRFKQIREMAEWEMGRHGLIAAGWRFEFDNAMTRAACCHYYTKKITMSKRLVDKWSDAEVYDTILHEIAHALVGNQHGHNDVWKDMARRIGCSASVYHNHTFTQPKFVIVCACGQTQLLRYRVSPKLMDSNKRICKFCSSTEKRLYAWGGCTPSSVPPLTTVTNATHIEGYVQPFYFSSASRRAPRETENNSHIEPFPL